MHTPLRFHRIVFLALIAVAVATFFALVEAQQRAAGAQVALDADDIGGTVTGARGPEAGVWVIAETTDLPTKMAKVVVTDDQGRYVIPDLPAASYQVWVRGYGLVDSPKLKATPGQQLNLTASQAPTAAAAAEYYPGVYHSDFARQVTSSVEDSQQSTINFTNNKLGGISSFNESYRTSKTRVCVTVGMMIRPTRLSCRNPGMMKYC